MTELKGTWMAADGKTFDEVSNGILLEPAPIAAPPTHRGSSYLEMEEGEMLGTVLLSDRHRPYEAL
jgi:hypothetical protein